MPPKKRKGVATTTLAKPKKPKLAKGRNALISTNEGEFTVLQYSGSPPLGIPRTYEAVANDAHRVQDGFLTLKLPKHRYSSLLETLRDRAAHPTTQTRVENPGGWSADDSTEVESTKGGELSQVRVDSAVDVSTPIEGNFIAEQSHLSKEPVPSQAGSDEFDQVQDLEVSGPADSSEAKGAGSLVELSIRSTGRSSAEAPVLQALAHPQELTLRTVGDTTSPGGPAYSPITPGGEPIESKPDSAVNSPRENQIQAEPRDFVPRSESVARTENNTSDSEQQILPPAEPGVPETQGEFGKPYAVPITAHHSFITLKLREPKRRVLPVTAHHSFITLKLPKTKSPVVASPASDSGIAVKPVVTVLPVTAHHSFLTLKTRSSESRSSRSPTNTSKRGHSRTHSRGRGKRRGNTVPSTRSTLVDQIGPEQAAKYQEATMAPVKDPNDVSTVIKDVIDTLYDVQSKTHGYIPETQDLLVDRMADLTNSLAHLRNLTDPQISPNNPVHNIRIPPEIVDYVDEGRNPDIFTREFVENVQRGNAVINGKKQAFKDFSVIFAKKLKEGIGGIDQHVDRIMEQAGLEKELAEAMKKDPKPDEQARAQENGEKE